MKTYEYSTQCLEHYFVKINESCPITDIKFEKTKSNEYQNYIQISENEYLYFTKENKLGKLYKYFNYSEFKKNKEDIFVFDKKGVRKELNKLKNPVLEFKYYVQFYDVLCSILIIISLYYAYFESINELKFDWFSCCNLFYQSMILILYTRRFIKFLEMKKFFLKMKIFIRMNDIFQIKYLIEIISLLLFQKIYLLLIYVISLIKMKLKEMILIYQKKNLLLFQ